MPHVGGLLLSRTTHARPRAAPSWKLGPIPSRDAAGTLALTLALTLTLTLGLLQDWSHQRASRQGGQGRHRSPSPSLKPIPLPLPLPLYATPSPTLALTLT